MLGAIIECLHSGATLHTIYNSELIMAQFISLLENQEQAEPDADLPLRMMFCNFLSACAFTTLARAEDNIQASVRIFTVLQLACTD